MTIKAFLKTVFSIPMLLLYWFCYHFRYDLLLMILQFYANHFSFGQPFVDRLIGESYFSQSYIYAKQASGYFQKSLAFYEKDFEHQKDMKIKGEEAFLIGSQYECGKGVDADPKKAQQWYETAVNIGYSEAEPALNRVADRLKAGTGASGNQCLFPDVR